MPIWVSLACTRRDRSAASALDPASSSTSLPRRWSASHIDGGAVVGGFLVGAADPAVPVVGGDRGQVAVAEPDAGLPFPVRVEPADLVQLRGGDLAGQQAEHAPGFDGAELGGVAGGDDPRPGLPGRFGDHGQVGGAELAGLIQHEHVVRCSGTGLRSSSEPSVLPRNSAML